MASSAPTYSDFLDSRDSLCLASHASELHRLATSLQGGIPFFIRGHAVMISPQAAAHYTATFAEGWSRRHPHRA